MEKRGVTAWDYAPAAAGPAWSEELAHLRSSRGIVREMVVRDLKVRYKRSILGAAWSLASPLALMAVLTLVFSGTFAGQTRSYPLFVFPALLLWNFFAQTTSTIAHSVAQGVDLWRRVRIPKSALPLSATISGVLHLVIGALAIVIVLTIAGHRPAPALLTIPLAIAAIALFTLGVAMLVAAVALHFPDAADLYQTLLPIWMFATPIIYPASILPPRLRPLAAWNPMALFVDLFRPPFADGRAAAPATFALAFAIAAATCVAGWLAFTRSAHDAAKRG